MVLDGVIGQPLRSTRVRASAASDVYKGQVVMRAPDSPVLDAVWDLTLIHISEPTRLLSKPYAVFWLKKKKKRKK